MQILFRVGLCMLLLSGTGILHAQAPPSRRLDLSITYVAEHSLKAQTSQSFWMQGGSIELGANVWRTGTHTGSIGSSNLPLLLVTTTFGHPDRRVSLYIQGLVGEANGFRSIFPATAGSQPDANPFAAQFGGVVDYRLSDRFAMRVLDAVWARTQLPNSSDNVQKYPSPRRRYRAALRALKTAKPRNRQRLRLQIFDRNGVLFRVSVL